MVTVIATHPRVNRVSFNINKDELEAFLLKIKKEGYKIIQIIEN